MADVDLTRENRSSRRNILKKTGMRIPGRTMPFVKKPDYAITDYNRDLKAQIEAEEVIKNTKKAHEQKKVPQPDADLTGGTTA